MAPIYDTDIAEERWSKTEWSQYELWEKIEAKLRKRKMIWIIATVILFAVLSAVPVAVERSPKWTTFRAARLLAQEVSSVKEEAGRSQEAYRIRFVGGEALEYVVEKGETCSQSTWTAVRTGKLISSSKEGAYSLLAPEVGEQLGIPGLMDSFCYDYLAGSSAVLAGNSMVGFGIIPVKDLSESRLDRLSLLVVRGPSADISFE